MKTVDFDSSMIQEIGKKQHEIESTQKSVVCELRKEISDLKSRSMRDNLMFYQIPEERDENCAEKVLQFVEEKLKIDKALHRAHRVGAYDRAKTRPIVAKFAFFPDREKVRKSSKHLSGTQFGISEQFPKDVMDRRKVLIPVMKKARQEGKEAYLKVDKLFINNQLYRDATA